MKRPVFRPRNTSRARQLRRDMTPAERILWRHLSRNQRAGWHFTKQFEIGPFHADFCCRSANLVIEVDGWTHDLDGATDARRDAYMRRLGYEVLRFTNTDVCENVEGVVFAIDEALAARPSPSPSRKREGS